MAPLVPALVAKDEHFPLGLDGLLGERDESLVQIGHRYLLTICLKGKCEGRGEMPHVEPVGSILRRQFDVDHVAGVPAGHGAEARRLVVS